MFTVVIRLVLENRKDEKLVRKKSDLSFCETTENTRGAKNRASVPRKSSPCTTRLGNRSRTDDGVGIQTPTDVRKQLPTRVNPSMTAGLWTSTRRTAAISHPT